MLDTVFKQNSFREKNPSSEPVLNGEHMSKLSEDILVFIIWFL